MVSWIWLPVIVAPPLVVPDVDVVIAAAGDVGLEIVRPVLPAFSAALMAMSPPVMLR